MVLDILKEQPRIADNPYVFPGPAAPALNTFSRGMNALRKLFPPDMPAFSMHDLRRTARKLMSRAGVRPDVGELAIGHSIKGIQAIYDDPKEYQKMTMQHFKLSPTRSKKSSIRLKTT